MDNKSKFQFQKATSPLKGDVCLLGDKSLAHRAMLFGALAKGKSIVTNFPDTGVTRAMLGCLQSLGVKIKVQNCKLEVEGDGIANFNKLDEKAIPTCNCNNSATTMRLLLGTLVGSKISANVIGSKSLSNRPIRIDQELRELGIDAIETTDGHLPAYVHSGNEISFSEHQHVLKYVSAQVKSALILVALCSRQSITLSEKIQTRDHTENMLRSIGLDVIETINADNSHNIYVKPLAGELSPLVGKLPSDPSSAAFVLVSAALVPNSEVVVRDILLNENRIRFLDILERMGCKCEIHEAGISFGEKYGDIKLKSPSSLKATAIQDPIEISQTIDELPAIAMLMSRAVGVSSIRNAKELRYKESDRIRSILNAYSELKLKFHEYEDGFAVEGIQNIVAKRPIQTFGDHRIAMAFSLLGLVGEVEIDDRNIIDESFSDFVETIERLK